MNANVARDHSPSIAAPRSWFLLMFAAMFMLNAMDEFAVWSTGTLAPRWLNLTALAFSVPAVWLGRRLPWKLAAAILFIAIALLAYAALWLNG